VTSFVSSPEMSAVTGKILSPATQTAYATNWSLFTDWCSATGHTPMPTDAAALAEFAAGCPAAPATIRRRLAAITHYHRIAGHQLPADPDPAGPPEPTRPPMNPDQVTLAMRLLPSHGWIGGLFGRRDRALLAVAAHTQIPYRQIARLTVGQLHTGGGEGGGATITDAHGAEHVLASNQDPVLCGPCALLRWRRLLDITHTKKTHMDDFLGTAKQVTSASHHPCQAPKPFDPRTLEVALFPPINQWGHFAVQIRPLTPHAISRLARQAETGLTAHKMLRVEEFTAAINSEDLTTIVAASEPPAEPAPLLRPVWDWAAANERKKAAITALAPLTDVLDDIDARIDELFARTRQLETH